MTIPHQVGAPTDASGPATDAIDDEGPPERTSRFTAWRRLPGWAQASIALGLYVVAAIAVWAAPIITELGIRYVGSGRADAKIFQWSVGWVHWAIDHHVDPLTTNKIFTPDGMSLAWTTFIPGGGILVYPIRSLFGSVAAVNTLLLLASVLACWATYLVCHRLTHSFWPSVAGGYLFGYSQYMAGQLHGHVNLVLIFPVPLVVYLVIRVIDGSLGWLAFVAWTTLCLTSLFLFSTEVFATTALFGAVAFAIAAIAAGRDRTRVIRAAALTGAAYLITFALVSPYLVSAAHNPPGGSIRDASKASIDLLSFVVPRPLVLLSPGFTETWSDRFLAHPIEDAGYVSLALVAVLIGFAVTERHRRGTWALLAFIGFVSLAALGPILHVMGSPSVWLPWSLVQDAPLIRNATPDRFPAYSALAIGVLSALWLARSPAGQARYRWGLVILGAVLLFPDVGAIPHLPQTVPAFFSSGEYRDVLRPDEVVFAIPRNEAEELSWQDSTDFWFRLAEGHLGVLPDRYANDPLNRGFSARSSPAMEPSRLSDWLNERQVTAIVVADEAEQTFASLIGSVGGELVHQGGGVSVWRSPTAVWAPQGAAP